jgi:hypothetical protein
VGLLAGRFSGPDPSTIKTVHNRKDSLKRPESEQFDLVALFFSKRQPLEFTSF